MPRLTSKVIVQGSMPGGVNGGVTSTVGAADAFRLYTTTTTSLPSDQFPSVYVSAYRNGVQLAGSGLTAGVWLAGSIIYYTLNSNLFSFVLEEDGEFVGSPVILSLNNILTSPSWNNIFDDVREELSLTGNISVNHAVNFNRVKIPAPNREVWTHKIDEQYTEETNLNSSSVVSPVTIKGRSTWIVNKTDNIAIFDRLVEGIKIWKVIGVATDTPSKYSIVTATRRLIES